MATAPPLRTSIASASFVILGVEIVGHVLDDGTRIIEADCVQKLMEAMAAPGAGDKVDLAEFQRFSVWQQGRG